MLLRAPTPDGGLVGRFLDIAPILLHTGRSTQTPPPKAQEDWWLQCVHNELGGHLSERPLPLTSPSSSGAVMPLGEGPRADWWADLVDTELQGHKRPTGSTCAPPPRRDLVPISTPSTPTAGRLATPQVALPVVWHGVLALGDALCSVHLQAAEECDRWSVCVTSGHRVRRGRRRGLLLRRAYCRVHQRLRGSGAPRHRWGVCYGGLNAGSCGHRATVVRPSANPFDSCSAKTAQVAYSGPGFASAQRAHCRCTAGS